MNFEMISVRELNCYVRTKKAFIIDLRTPEEYEQNHIEGAINIPYNRLEYCKTLPEDMEIVLYCERGAVSMVAAKKLAAKGYHVKTVIGGIYAYYAYLREEKIDSRQTWH